MQLLTLFTTNQHLRIRRPSPTTVNFIISTSAPPTLLLQILQITSIFVRVFVSLNIFLLLYSKFQSSLITSPLQPHSPTPEIFTNDYIWHQIYLLTNSRLGQRYSSFTSKVPATVLLPGAFFALYLLLLRFHTTESLLVLRSLGLQISSSSRIFGVGNTTRFIPTEKVQDILINEAFRGFEVRYYLVVVIQDEEELMVVFPKLSPRREMVEIVWRGARACLWEGGYKEGERGAEE